MNDGAHVSWEARVEAIYRSESRRVLATLIRLFGDFDLAEESLHEAFAAAVVQWPRDGLPNEPRAWLIKVGHLRGIDVMRRRRRHDLATADLGREEQRIWPPPQPPLIESVTDDRLRLLFVCCRPELPEDARIALTLRELCGLTTEEIARAYLVRASTIAQRIVRAKQRIRELQLPYEVPGPSELPARTASVRRVIYLVFNEGYSASSGSERTRVDLSEEAIRLARLLAVTSPDAETDGLLALMLLQDARRASRTSPTGELLLLSEQDRSLWDRSRIAEGLALVERALESGARGPYTLQAAIAAVHAESPDAASTDWRQIVALYELLLQEEPTPVVRLARAIALAEAEGPLEGLVEVDAILAAGELAGYLPVHAARADLCRRLGRRQDALVAYHRALSLASLEPERRFFERRIAELGG
ncbi:MAG: RNA polymerase sigma factor [Candidatus Eisenbacteria bacterium]|uniref:RNA polymerase sigma factor n=1 Tax=Eiseniibacteriota bacterium TaxID=2212470 RepID=A0A956SCT4_UNCEI|nr:RNA polymerase sigma factor [Candidatus Eisenbacteria bacterium]MCB9466301.1 RNA polymerase sigma factor [Candidatus Eisenbacteria bacterium]